MVCSYAVLFQLGSTHRRTSTHQWWCHTRRSPPALGSVSLQRGLWHVGGTDRTANPDINPQHLSLSCLCVCVLFMCAQSSISLKSLCIKLHLLQVTLIIVVLPLFYFQINFLLYSIHYQSPSENKHSKPIIRGMFFCSILLRTRK